MKIISDAELCGWKLAVWILFIGCVVLLWKLSALSLNKGTEHRLLYNTDTVYLTDTVHDTVPYYQTKTIHDTVYVELMDDDIDFNEPITS